MTILAESLAIMGLEQQQRARSHLVYKQEVGCGCNWEWCELFPVLYLLEQSHTSRSFLNSSTSFEPNIQTTTGRNGLFGSQFEGLQFLWQAGHGGQSMLQLEFIISIISMQKDRHAGVQLTFRESFSSSVKPLWKYHHKLIQRCVSQGILNPVMMTLKTSHDR